MLNALERFSVLTVPGWNSSGPLHWQTLWEQKYSRFRRVEQHNWAEPIRADWSTKLDRQVQCAPRPVFFVAHSLGCLAVAHWAACASRERTDRVAGAFLVAPPWLCDSDKCPKALAGFRPMPLNPLPFPCMLVVSEDDHYLPFDLALHLGEAWGARLVSVGRKGHINVASGHGPWAVGEELLSDFAGTTLTSDLAAAISALRPSRALFR